MIPASWRAVLVTVGLIAILVDCAQPTPIISTTTSITNVADDGEEYRTNTKTHYSGEVVLDSSDLELCRETSVDVKDPRYQVVGLRFTDVMVPKGATVVSAFVEFAVDTVELKQAHKSAGLDKDISLTITGEFVDDATRFRSVNRDISRRINPGTPNTVTWVETEEWTDDTKRNTPDISPIIQDIVDQRAWRSGNALVLVLFGTTEDKGTRIAYSSDSGPGLGPKLRLDFSLPAQFDGVTGSPTPDPAQKQRAAPCPTRDPNGIFSRGCIRAVPTPDPTPSPTQAPTRATPSPTLAPTQMPTASPTKFPTPSPTLAPTQMPTASPTKFPTPSPTLAPTQMPTASPTKFPTPPPTLGPTQIPTASPTEFPIPSPTRSPTHSPTFEPTRLPTVSPTLSITPKPTPYPTAIQTKSTKKRSSKVLGTGIPCSGDSECRSKTCRNGVCMASATCQPIKHKFGSPFDSNTVNLVFVGSAFDTSTREAWHAQVNTTYRHFGKYNMLSEAVEELNVFFVDPVDLDKSFCQHRCARISRLLCCEIEKAHALASQCFSVGANLQTVVIHNDDRYGGAGYHNENIATMSTHPKGPLVAIHELGHSLFELTDEYGYGPGTGKDPNCAASSDCSKWKDLIGNTPQGYREVGCVPGCMNGNFYVAETTFMNDLAAPVGAVNERYSCCTYQALAKSMPSYCDVFDFSPNYLFDYCKNNDFQRYGAASYNPKVADEIKTPGMPAPVGLNESSKYIYVAKPMFLKVKLRKNGKAGVRDAPIGLPAGIFHSTQVKGEFRSLKSAAKLGVHTLLKVKVFYVGAGKDVLYFSPNTKIEVPLLPNRHRTEGDGAPRRVSQKAKVVELILDTNGRKIRRVRAQVIPTNASSPITNS